MPMKTSILRFEDHSKDRVKKFYLNDTKTLDYIIKNRVNEFTKKVEPILGPGRVIGTTFDVFDIKKIIKTIIAVQHRMRDYPDDWKDFAFQNMPNEDTFREEAFETSYKADLFFLREFFEDLIEMPGFERITLG